MGGDGYDMTAYKIFEDVSTSPQKMVPCKRNLILSSRYTQILNDWSGIWARVLGSFHYTSGFINNINSFEELILLIASELQCASSINIC